MCTVDGQEYHNELEPIGLTYTPDTWDHMWLADKPWEYLLKLLEAGEIRAEVWGKQIVILCGHVSIFHWTVDFLADYDQFWQQHAGIISFGLASHMISMK